MVEQIITLASYYYYYYFTYYNYLLFITMNITIDGGSSSSIFNGFRT